MDERSRQPLLVAAAQLSERGEARPEEMLAGVARRALAESGSGAQLLAALDSIIGVESLSWPLPDPALALAVELGAKPAETVRTLTSGTAPVEALADAATRIATGERRAALIAGVECFDVLMRAMKAGRDPGFPTQPEGTEPTRVIGAVGEVSHPLEQAAGLIAPVAYYPLFESAVRGAAGRSPAEHQEYLGRLWASFSGVAAHNPHAWSPERLSPSEIATPSAANRQVSIPYTKRMNSNIQVNQAAALVLCSAELADELGIADERRISIRASASASDRPFVGERQRLDRSPALAACGEHALSHAGLGIEAIDHLDLYSCFPSAVEVACGELDIDPFDEDRSSTVTGGLSFAGGPGNNYVTHSIAALHERLRTSGGRALATAVGWYLTKHGVVVLDADDGADGSGYEHFRPQAAADAAPGRALRPPPSSGEARIESYTGICDRDGAPEVGIATFLLPDGARTVARSGDPRTLARLLHEDALDSTATFAADGTFRLGPG